MSFFKVLTPEQEKIERLSGYRAVFQQADQILAGERLRVEIAEDGPAVGWTDGMTITLNAGMVEDSDFEQVERLYGANFHELSHVLYTPRRGTNLVSWVLQEGYQVAFNILEDIRIERMMTTRYRSTIPWLTAGIARWIITTDEDSLKGGYIFARGRKYLPAAMRRALRDTFAKPELLPEVEAVVDGYRTLVFPTDDEVGKDFIKRMHEILQQLNPMQDAYGHADGKGSSGRNNGNDTLTAGRAESSRDQRQTQRDANFQEGMSQGDSGEGDEDGDEGEDSASGAGLGQSPNQSRDLDEIARSVANQTLNQIRQDSGVQREVRKAQNVINNKISKADNLPKARFRNREVDPEYVAAARKFARVLEKIRAQYEPGWEKAVSTGKVNVARFMREKDYGTAFDAWEEGQNDATDIEAVLLIDTSGSMDPMAENAAQSLWAVKRALDTVGARVTVLTFGSESYRLYDANEKAESANMRYYHDSSGTDPSDAISAATRILGRSRRSIKVLVSITDGEWYDVQIDGRALRKHVESLNGTGVVTAMGYVVPSGSRGGRKPDGQGHTIVETLNGADDLHGFARTIVTSAIHKKMRTRVH